MYQPPADHYFTANRIFRYLFFVVVVCYFYRRNTDRFYYLPFAIYLFVCTINNHKSMAHWNGCGHVGNMYKSIEDEGPKEKENATNSCEKCQSIGNKGVNFLWVNTQLKQLLCLSTQSFDQIIHRIDRYVNYFNALNIEQRSKCDKGKNEFHLLAM